MPDTAPDIVSNTIGLLNDIDTIRVEIRFTYGDDFKQHDGGILPSDVLVVDVNDPVEQSIPIGYTYYNPFTDRDESYIGRHRHPKVQPR